MEQERLTIPVREALHFLGWRGAPVEPELEDRLRTLCAQVGTTLEPRTLVRTFDIGEDGVFAGTRFCPAGSDVHAMLAPCFQGVLLAATLGAQSERMLLRAQARDAADALLLDAVLSAAIEAVCDAQEAALRRTFQAQGLFLTDRFSPGYGDMPLAQSAQILAVLDAPRRIGLTLSASGLMLPRKSVTAVMGVSREPVARRPSGCEACSARETCAFRRGKAIHDEEEARNSGNKNGGDRG